MNSLLLTAYYNKNFQEFEQLLASGKINPDINLGLGNNKKQNLLVYICNSINEIPTPHNLTFVELLLKFGANPNICCHPPGIGYKVPLVAIVEKLPYGEHVLSYFKLLLDFGANPNFLTNIVNDIAYTDVGNYCITALQYALEAGANKNVPINSLGWSVVDGLRVRIENPPRYNVRNLGIIIAMKQLLENFGAVSSNLFNNKRNTVITNVAIYRNVYMQNQQIENQKRLAEEQRIATEKRLAEEQRIAIEKRIATEKRLAEEQRIANEKRLAEEQRIAIEKRLAEEQRIAIEKRLAEEQRIATEKRLAEEQSANEIRLVEEKIMKQKLLDEQNKLKTDLALRYLSWAIDNITYLGKNNEFIAQQVNSTDEDAKEFISAIESFKTCTASILLKSGNLMPPEILAKLSIPDEYNDMIRLQTPISIIPPPMTQFIMPPVTMPQLTITAPLHPDFCRLIPTPQHLLPTMPPFHFDTSNPTGQPIGLIGLKNTFNSIAEQVFDGTVGVSHPLEPFLQKEMLETLSSQIDGYCSPK